jgi:hypothetical protein
MGWIRALERSNGAKHNVGVEDGESGDVAYSVNGTW